MTDYRAIHFENTARPFLIISELKRMYEVDLSICLSVRRSACPYCNVHKNSEIAVDVNVNGIYGNTFTTENEEYIIYSSFTGTLKRNLLCYGL